MMRDAPPPAAPVIMEAPLSGAEAAALLDRVGDIQQARAGAMMAAQDVPGVLLGYQQRWHLDVSRVRIAEKSRRIGFSWGCLGAEAVLEAGTRREAGGMDQFYMGYNRDMAAEFIGDCAFFARAYQEALGSQAFQAGQIGVERSVVILENERRDIITYSVRLASGFKIEALSSNPHNWRGRQGHARVDEAAFHPGLQEVIKGALAFLMWGGRVDIVSSHNGEESEFNTLIKAVIAGKLPWSHHRVTFDDALGDGFYGRVALVRGQKWTKQGEIDYRAATYADYPRPEDAAEELDCVPKRGSGVYFPRALIEKRWIAGLPVFYFAKPAEYVLDDARLDVARAWLNETVIPALRALNPARRHALGQDFGRSGDLSVIWALAERAAGVWETALYIELRNIPFDVQQLILLAVIDRLPHFHRGCLDARGNGQAHAEAAMQYTAKKFGRPRIECVMATAQFYAAAFPRYRAALEDGGLASVPMLEDIAADHRRVVLAAGRPGVADGKDKGSDGGDRHGDSAIAGLLAWQATLEDGAAESAGESVDPGDVADDEEGVAPDGLTRARAMAAALGRRMGAMFGRGN
jgi:phage FluMu gp28-like protein